MMSSLATDRHDEVLRTGLHVLVFRMAESPACRQFQPELDAFARDRPEIAVWTVEAMQQRELSDRHGLRALPSVMVYREGLPCRRFAGAMSAGQLAEAVDEVAAADLAEEHNDWLLWVLESGEAGSPYLGDLPSSGSSAPSGMGDAGEPVSGSAQVSRSVGTPMRAAGFTALRPARPAHPAQAAQLSRPLRSAAVPMSPMSPVRPAVANIRAVADEDSPGAEDLMTTGVTAWYAGDVAKALRAFTILLEMDPTSPGVLSSRGQVLADNGGGALAVKDLDRAMAGTVDEFSVAYARSARALALAQVGRHDEADQDMAAALAVTPNSAWAHLRKARIHLLRGDVAGMGTALRRALETSEPPLTDHQRAMAEALLRLG
jgi:Flp pilus assembly protein TadD